jgi:hypothetical protein
VRCPRQSLYSSNGGDDMPDPIVLIETTIIVGMGMFYGWWFSPVHRRHRHHVERRIHAELYRAFHQNDDQQ